MTREEIENMRAGREMDAAIHTALTGQKVLVDPSEWRLRQSDNDEFVSLPFVPFYSINISAAFEVFKEGLMRFGQAAIFADMEDYGRGTFFGNGPEEVMTVSMGNWQMTDKVKVAICKTFLLAATQPAPTATSTGEGSNRCE